MQSSPTALLLRWTISTYFTAFLSFASPVDSILGYAGHAGRRFVFLMIWPYQPHFLLLIWQWWKSGPALLQWQPAILTLEVAYWRCLPSPPQLMLPSALSLAYGSVCTEQEEQILKWSICTRLTVLFWSHLHYIINYHKQPGYFMQLLKQNRLTVQLSMSFNKPGKGGYRLSFINIKWEICGKMGADFNVLE